jgi:nicotinate-nucleotide pyrophosphorylase (carboxylating)
MSTNETVESSVNWQEVLGEKTVQSLIEVALEEDIGSGDVTTQAIFSTSERVRAHMVTRGRTTACALPLAEHLLRRYDSDAVVENHARNGARLEAGEVLVHIEADVRALLTVERCMLNFLMRLCGIAEAARLAAAAIPPHCRARVYDTRKTTPGWRLLEKAAVRTGGACNHRQGLFDAVLIKDNHIRAAGAVGLAVRRARAHVGDKMCVEVEVDTLEQLDEALEEKPDIILLDNFSAQMQRAAVERVGAWRALHHWPVELEASGGITLEGLAAVAETGVDRISLGALTHTVRPADLSLEFL